MMLFLAWAAAAVGAAPVAGSPAHGSVDYDVQCMIATDSAAGRVDAATKEKLGRLLMFYFGRVDAVVSGDALKRQMVAAAKRLQGRPLGPVVQDCGQFMTDHATAMERTGRTLQSQAKSGSAK